MQIRARGIQAEQVTADCSPSAEAPQASCSQPPPQEPARERAQVQASRPGPVRELEEAYSALSRLAPAELVPVPAQQPLQQTPVARLSGFARPVQLPLFCIRRPVRSY